MMAGAPDRAFASAGRAIALTQDDADLLIDRAIAALSLERYRERRPTTSATRSNSTRPELTRWCCVPRPGACWASSTRRATTSTAPSRRTRENPDAFLERGILRQRGGDWDGARDDWQRAISLAPDSATGDLAQQNLALLEAGPDRR